MVAVTRFRSAAVLIVLAVLMWLVPVRGFAQETPRLQGQVTDLTRSQVLASEQARIQDALAELLQRDDIQLFVLFVDSTGGLPVTQFASGVARASSLGGNDALLVVALADRTDALWRGPELTDRLTDRELSQVLTRRVEPLLGQGDFPGAVVGAARGLGEVAGAGASPVQGPPGGPGGAQAPGVNLGPLLGIGALALGGAWLWSTRSRRREQERTAKAKANELEQLARDANARLINADEALRAAQQETAFAEAQFSEEDVAPYRTAVGQASAELKRAFTLRQQLDDDIPEDDATRHRLLTELLEHTQRAQTLLDEQRARLEELRDLERHAPEVLAALPGQLDALETRLPEARRTLMGLQRFAPTSVASVDGNLAEAEKRLAAGRQEVAAGQQALAANDASGAARRARTAQHAQTEAAQLLDAVDALATALRQAQQSITPQLATARADLATARDAVARSAERAGAARLDEAEQMIRQAEAQMAAPQPDVLAAYRLATRAEAIADEILADVQEQAAQRAREGELLAAELQVAEVSYGQAADYIAARHGGIGREARTRLAEAERHLTRARALADSDPRAARTEAQAAERRAREAYTRAQADFEDYDRHGRGSGGMGGIPIPFPIVVGGGWGGAGWGGSPWGSSGGEAGGGAVGGGWSAGTGGGGGAVGGHW